MKQDICRQVEIPELNLIEDDCNGEKINTLCMIIDKDFPEIEVHKGDPLLDVITKLVERLQKITLETSFYKKRIDELYKQIEM